LVKSTNYAVSSILPPHPYKTRDILFVIECDSNYSEPNSNEVNKQTEDRAMLYEGRTQFQNLGSCGNPTRRSPPSWGLGEGLTTPQRKHQWQALVSTVMNLRLQKKGNLLTSFVTIRFPRTLLLVVI
jgi:hypothetical protein